MPPRHVSASFALRRVNPAGVILHPGCQGVFGWLGDGLEVHHQQQKKRHHPKSYDQRHHNVENTNHFNVFKAKALLMEWPQNGQLSVTVLVRYDPQYNQCDAVESEPVEVLAPHVHLELGVSQPADPEDVLCRVQPGPDQLHRLLDVGNTAGMHACANKEVVEPPWEVLLVEKKLDHQPQDNVKEVNPDGIVSEYGKDQRDGAKFEGAVDEEDRPKAKKPPDLLARAESMSSSICQKTLYPRPHQEKKGPKSCSILKGRRMPVRFEEEDEELEKILEVSIEEPVSYPDLAG